MSKTDDLIKAYRSYIEIPWREDVAPAQRTIFCFYDPKEEIKVRGQLKEFELNTLETGHKWLEFDMTDLFALWMMSNKYRDNYFKQPEKLAGPIGKFLEFLVGRFSDHLKEHGADKDTVVAVIGAGSVFELMKLSGFVEKAGPLVTGRLLVFFPGTYDNSIYKLLGAYDGWNYHAVPISATSTMITMRQR